MQLLSCLDYPSYDKNFYSIYKKRNTFFKGKVPALKCRSSLYPPSSQDYIAYCINYTNSMQYSTPSHALSLSTLEQPPSSYLPHCQKVINSPVHTCPTVRKSSTALFILAPLLESHQQPSSYLPHCQSVISSPVHTCPTVRVSSTVLFILVPLLEIHQQPCSIL